MARLTCSARIRSRLGLDAGIRPILAGMCVVCSAHGREAAFPESGIYVELARERRGITDQADMGEWVQVGQVQRRSER